MDALCERRTGVCRCEPGFEGAPPKKECVGECENDSTMLRNPAGNTEGTSGISEHRTERNRANWSVQGSEIPFQIDHVCSGILEHRIESLAH